MSSSPFASPEGALAGPGERLVRLHLRSAPGAPMLYVHPYMLRAWSGVLRPAVDLALDGKAGAGGGSGGEGGGGEGGAGSSGAEGSSGSEGGEDASGRFVTLPLDDEDAAVWEAALALMHPSAAPAKVTWDSAPGLLELAHKYDMPGITARVLEFVEAGGGSGGGVGSASASAALKGLLTEATAFQWLEVTSRCGLDALADACFDFINEQRLPLTLAALRALPEERAERLLRAAADREAQVVLNARLATPLELEVARLRVDNGRLLIKLDAAAQPSGPSCLSCRFARFTKPNGKPDRFCMNCGNEH